MLIENDEYRGQLLGLAASRNVERIIFRKICDCWVVGAWLAAQLLYNPGGVEVSGLGGRNLAPGDNWGGFRG